MVLLLGSLELHSLLCQLQDQVLFLFVAVCIEYPIFLQEVTVLHFKFLDGSLQLDNFGLEPLSLLVAVQLQFKQRMLFVFERCPDFLVELL